MTQPTETFAAHLRRLRKQRDLTQRDLAQWVGCSEDLIRKIEAGRRRPSRDLVRLLAAAFALTGDARAAFELHARADAIATPAAALGNLPAAVEPTFGRELETQRVCEALRAGATRLITLTGPGGVGKTHLARDIAERAANAFSGGVWWIALDAVSSADDACATLADTLGVKVSDATPPQKPIDAIAAFIGARAMLLVLDNFEHVLAAAADVRALLDACPALVCLITSRERLRLTSERVFVLKPLACAKPGASPHDVAISAAGSLFIERVTRLEADFEISPANAARIAEICRAVDGLPLAICIIAARAGMHSLGAIDSGFAAVHDSVDFTDAPDRHRSLDAALLWSYRLLDADEQRCFTRFSTLNGASLALASAVCDVPLIEKTLQALIDKCLLQREQHGDVMRFRQLAPVRQFARALLAAAGSDAEAEAHERMDVWLTTRLEHLYARYASGEPDMDAEWRRVDFELDNFRGAARRTQARGDIARLVALTSASHRWMWVRGHGREGIVLARDALALVLSADADLPRRDWLLADAGGTLGTYELDHGDIHTGLDLLRESAAIAMRIGHDVRAISSLINLANGLATVAGYDEALAHCDACATLCARVRDDYGLADVEACRGLVAFYQGDLVRSRAGFEAAVAIHRRMRNQSAELIVLGNLAVVCERQGDLDAAVATNQHTLALARAAGMPSLVAGICGNLASISVTRRDNERAKAYLAESLEVALASAELVLLRNGFVTAASLAMALEEGALAADYLAMAERVRTIHGGPYEPDSLPTVDALTRLLGDAVSAAAARYAGQAPDALVARTTAWLRAV